MSDMTPRQQARAVLKPLFARPVSPEESRVCDALASVLDVNRRRIKELEAENESLKDRLAIWEPKPPPPKGERGFETPTKKGKRK